MRYADGAGNTRWVQGIVSYIGVQIPHGKGQFLGKGAPIVKYRDTLVTCAKIAKPIVMQFGLWAWSASRNHEVDEGPKSQLPHKKGQFWGKGSPF